MKTSELIKALQEADPEGNAEVVVDGGPIYFVEHLEGYYDGWYEVLIQDHSKDPYYNIKGTRFTAEKSKVRLHLMGFEDVLLDNPDAIMEIDHSTMQYHEAELSKRIEEKRAEMKEIHRKVDEEMKEKRNDPKL